MRSDLHAGDSAEPAGLTVTMHKIIFLDRATDTDDMPPAEPCTAAHYIAEGTFVGARATAAATCASNPAERSVVRPSPKGKPS